MNPSQVAAACRNGFVCAVFSRRAKGFVIPADLLRQQARSARLASERRRVRAAFAEYLA
jgi:hypothetical protein